MYIYIYVLLIEVRTFHFASSSSLLFDTLIHVCDCILVNLLSPIYVYINLLTIDFDFFFFLFFSLFDFRFNCVHFSSVKVIMLLPGDLT